MPSDQHPPRIELRAVTDDEPRPSSPSRWDEWGERDPEAAALTIHRWVIDLVEPDGGRAAVGDLSAHLVWYGPTTGSKAMNIGISIVPEQRGRGIGSMAQRLLAQELHDRGIVRVEASTDVENIAEQRALARAGFTLEGTLRSAQARADGRHDLQVWSHLADDPPVSY